MGGRNLYASPDADPHYAALDAVLDQRAIFRRRIEALRAEGVSYERAVDAVVGPVGTDARAWWES